MEVTERITRVLLVVLLRPQQCLTCDLLSCFFKSSIGVFVWLLGGRRTPQQADRCTALTCYYGVLMGDGNI